jgi:hypothetical protein
MDPWELLLTEKPAFLNVFSTLHHDFAGGFHANEYRQLLAGYAPA